MFKKYGKLSDVAKGIASNKKCFHQYWFRWGKIIALQIWKTKCFLDLTKTLVDKSLAEKLFNDIGADSVDKENNSSGRIGGKIESFFNQRTLWV